MFDIRSYGGAWVGALSRVVRGRLEVEVIGQANLETVRPLVAEVEQAQGRPVIIDFSKCDPVLPGEASTLLAVLSVTAGGAHVAVVGQTFAAAVNGLPWRDAPVQWFESLPAARRWLARAAFC